MPPSFGANETSLGVLKNDKMCVSAFFYFVISDNQEDEFW